MRWWTVFLQVLLLLLSSGCSRTDATLQERASGALLQRYETVVAVRSSRLSQLHPGSTNTELGARVLGLPFIYLIAGLKAVSANAFGIVEKRSDFAFTGAKDFVAPEGLGMVTSRASTIVILTPGSALTLTRLFKNIKESTMDGKRVWTWSGSLSEGNKPETTFYAAIVAGSLFVIANDATEFREVASAMERPTIIASPPDVISLRHHAYWAHRTIRRNPSADNWASGLTDLPESAIGLQLFTDFDDRKLVFDILVPDDPSGNPPKGLPSSALFRFQRTSPGKWQATIPLSIGSSQITAAEMAVLYYFGYGVFL
jgi:hypothetical protein